MKKTPKAERHTVFLTPPQSEFLKREAGKKGITVSDLVRRIVDYYMEAEGV